MLVIQDDFFPLINSYKSKIMACPFMDPKVLARIPEDRREQMKETYHQMRAQEQDSLKIDIKEEDLERNPISNASS